jgi:hypothetical protein
MAARRLAAVADPDQPEPLPVQTSWLDPTPVVEFRGGRYYATMTARWTLCRCGRVLPNVAQGRSICVQCGSKPAVHLCRAVLSSVSAQTVDDEVQRLRVMRPRDYFVTEGRHDVDLDAVP